MTKGGEFGAGLRNGALTFASEACAMGVTLFLQLDEEDVIIYCSVHVFLHRSAF